MGRSLRCLKVGKRKCNQNSSKCYMFMEVYGRVVPRFKPRNLDHLCRPSIQLTYFDVLAVVENAVPD